MNEARFNAHCDDCYDFGVCADTRQQVLKIQRGDKVLMNDGFMGTVTEITDALGMEETVRVDVPYQGNNWQAQRDITAVWTEGNVPEFFKDPAETQISVKHDTDKLPMELLPASALMTITKVLAFGAQKYTPNNWRKGGFMWSRLSGAALRHVWAFIGGEDNDPESGLPHIAHAACCLIFLLEHITKSLGKDDRFKYEEK